MPNPALPLQERFDFLLKFWHDIPEEDFEVAMKAYEWPKKFVTIMKEAASKATLGQLTPCCVRMTGKLATWVGFN